MFINCLPETTETEPVGVSIFSVYSETGGIATGHGAISSGNVDSMKGISNKQLRWVFPNTLLQTAASV